MTFPRLRIGSKREREQIDPYVVTVGGGAAGVATASSLLERDARLSIVVVGRANEHF